MLQSSCILAKINLHTFYTCRNKRSVKMIQGISSANNYSKVNNQSFGRKDFSKDGEYTPKKPSKAARMGVYLGTQFAAGVLVQAVIDGVINGVSAIRKKPTIPFKQIAQRSAFTGAIFAVIGLVFTGIGALMANKHKNQ